MDWQDVPGAGDHSGGGEGNTTLEECIRNFQRRRKRSEKHSLYGGNREMSKYTVHQIKIDFHVTEQICRFVYVYIIEGKSLYLIDSGVSGCEKQADH